MNIDPSIFRAYDIRGIYPDQVNKDLAYKLGSAFAVFLKPKKVMVGRDMRLSSADLSKSLIQGITDQGADVIDIGLAASPVFLYGLSKYGLDGGIIVTASHNPKEYNGFKLVKEKKVLPITEETGLKKIKEIMAKNEFKPVFKKGKAEEKNILDEFIASIFEKVNPEEINSFKIVADASNGMGGIVFPKLFDYLKCQVIPLYWELDGNFPNHSSNPLLTEAISGIKKKVLEEKADLGIITDGDADRIVFIDEKGNRIGPDLVIALIAKELLAANPNQKILYDSRSSKIVKETIEASNGQPVLSKAGYSFIRQRMNQDEILFGGERSAHYYLKDICYRDAPFITALYLLRILTKEKKPISEIMRPFKKYFSCPEINFNVKDKNAIIKKVENNYKSGKISHLDGATIEFDNWWFNLRLSNTEPLLRLNIEAESQELLDEKIKEISEIIKNY